MSATLQRAGLTVEQLAARTGWRQRLLEEILADCELLGLVEHDAAGWRLSDEAEELYGDELRRLDIA